MPNSKDLFSKTILLIVDMQDRFASVIDQFAAVQANCIRLIQSAQLLGVDVVVTEQYPQKLGGTVSPIKELFSPQQVIYPKLSFSVWQDEAIRKQIQASQAETIWLAGIEAHVCIYQSARDLLKHKYHVEIISDAISSRAASDKEVGFKRMVQEGAYLSSVEMAVFDYMGSKQHPCFKEVSVLYKDKGKC